MRTVIITLLITSQVWGACARIGSSNRHFCPNTGNSTADGADLRTYLDSAGTTYACGDIIIVEEGDFLGLVIAGLYYQFNLKAQTCSPGQYTIIKGLRSAELRGHHPTVADIPKMPVLRANSGVPQGTGGSVLTTFPLGANNYQLDGIAISTSIDISTVDHGFYAGPEVGLGTGTGIGRYWPGEYSYNIDFNNVLITNAEEETYGVLAECRSISCALRSTGGAMSIGGRNFNLTGVGNYGQGGFWPSFGSVLAMLNPDTPGTGYAPGDTGTISSGTDLATYTVSTVNGSGGVTGITVTYGGWGYYTPRQQNGFAYNTVSTSGVGTGFQLALQAGDGTHYPVTAATNALSPELSITGIAATMNLQPDGGGVCLGAGGRPRCTRNCFDNNSCQFVLSEGFDSGDPAWYEMNGVNALVYKDANHAYMVKATQLEQFGKDGTFPRIDTSAASAYAGGAVLRPAGIKIDPIYQFNPTSVVGMNLRRNYWSNGDMTIFWGSAGTPLGYGIITASTWDGVDTGTITVDVETGAAQIGTVIAFGALTASSWCPSGLPCDGQSVDSNTYRPYVGTGLWTQAGIVTGISGTAPTFTYTLRPWGPNGMDQPAVIGALPGGVVARAQWNNILPSNILMTQSTIYRNPAAYETGKGPEMKTSSNTVFDGNDFSTVCVFQENKNQSFPWIDGGPQPTGAVGASCFRSIWSNSVWNNCGMTAISPQDYEATSSPINGCFYENNLTPAVKIFNGYNVLSGMAGSNNGAVSQHNTYFVDTAKAATVNWFLNDYIPLDCDDTGSYNDGYRKTYESWINNIFSYGKGIQLSVPVKNCWPNYLTAVRSNVMRNDDPDHTYTNMQIEAAWPNNNTAVTATSDIGFVGGATPDPAVTYDWALDPTSPFKGAAEDGSDPGANVYQIVDRQNGWSEQAGLGFYDMSYAIQFVPHPAAFQMGTTTGTMQFRRWTPTCSLTIYTDPSFQTEFADTNTSPKKACDRSGNTSAANGVVTFNIGTNTTMTADTRYWFMLTDGIRIMPGTFKTKP